ncbi:Pvc16 family protein [Actinokineospora auranticolor]|uniref:Pvc16 family protein n=1 Tax=Actinokineospora auranticolor TaxID=155976 RepID=UPI000CECDC5F|nr:Pvc16 family protein [Actinokineospora auranticolor]
MITEVDDALCVLLGRALPEGTAVRLDPPKPTWQTERPTKVVDLFLFGLRGDPRGREAGWAEVRDERGAVLSRRGPTRRCELSYLVTARAEKVGEEHMLLDRALRAVLFADTVPEGCLAGELAVAGEPVFLAVADADPGELWTNLGMPARAAFVVTASAALLADTDTELAPPAERIALRSGQDVPRGPLAPAGAKRWVRS